MTHISQDLSPDSMHYFERRRPNPLHTLVRLNIGEANAALFRAASVLDEAVEEDSSILLDERTQEKLHEAASIIASINALGKKQYLLPPT